MNANELLQHLQNDATLTKRYKFNSMKMVLRLRLSDGTVIPVQESCVSPLLRDGKVRSIEWSGGKRDYVLVERSKV